MMLSVLLLCLFLQKLQFCNTSGVDCKELVKRLNAYGNTAKEVAENWELCQATFLEDVSDNGIWWFFNALQTSSLAFSKQISQDIANVTEFASKIDTKQLEILINRGSVISSKFFAEVRDIAFFSGVPPGCPDLAENILEYYNGSFTNTSWITAAQFKLLGSKLDKEFLCTNLWIPDQDRDRLFESISLKCLRGLSRRGLYNMHIHWSKIPSEIIDEWTKKYLEGDLEHAECYHYVYYLPVQVWKKILESPEFVKPLPDNLRPVPRLALGAALSAIDHVRFAEIVRQRPELAKIALLIRLPKISANIFASCGKEEMEVFLPQLSRMEVEKNPSIVMNISSAVSTDKHFCKDMSFETYKSMSWLRRYANDKCMSLITVPDGRDPRKFLDYLGKMRIKRPVIDNV
jgi:hypothetical protein